MALDSGDSGSRGGGSSKEPGAGSGDRGVASSACWGCYLWWRMSKQHAGVQAGQHQEAAGTPAGQSVAAVATGAAAASGLSTAMQQPPVGFNQQVQQQQAQGRGGAAAPAADCMGCRLTGLALGVGGGGYLASRLFEQPYPKGAHKLAIISMSAGLFALGVSRALGF